jgi:signal peptidase I
VWHLLAQVETTGGVRNTIDQLARTPISIIVYISAVATALRLVLHWFTKDVPPHQRGSGFGVAKFFNEALDAVVYALVFVFLLIRPFGIQAFTIPTGSMWPTLKINDYIVANKAVYRYSDPQVGDIIVFKPPQHGLYPNQAGLDIDYIKRVQGVPGDVIEIKANVLYRNGKPVKEPYVHYTRSVGDSDFKVVPPSEVESYDFKLVEYRGEIWPVLYNAESVNSWGITMPEQFRADSLEVMEALRNAPPAAVPKGYLLVMGDNRNNSFDGRFWGVFERSRVIGRAEFIWFPVTRWGTTR